MFPFSANHVFSFTPHSGPVDVLSSAQVPAAPRFRIASRISAKRIKHRGSSIELGEFSQLDGHTQEADQNNKDCSLDQHPERKLLELNLDLLQPRAMKFSHSIQFNAVPDWSSNYINYSNLKKL